MRMEKFHINEHCFIRNSKEAPIKQGRIKKMADSEKYSLSWIIKLLAIAMALFHIYAIQFMPFSLDVLKAIHIMFALGIFYLMQIEEQKGNKISQLISTILLIGSMVTTTYVLLNFVELSEMMGIMNATATVLGLLLMISVWEGTRRKWGWIIPIFTLISLFYAYYGKLFPGEFHHLGVSFERLVGYSTMFFRGIFGSLTGISAATVYILFIFVGLLDVLGGSAMFIRLGTIMASKFRSGPAQSAVLCSALMGMISGSTAANVATTGSFTIPMMKSAGYKPGYAGAIECVASTGGQFTPPIMGAAAFIMVGLTGISYIKIAVAAIIPALLYYFYIGLSVELRARKENINATGTVNSDNTTLLILKQNYHLLIPIFVLLYFLIKQYSAGQSAIIASYTLCLLKFVKELTTSKTGFITTLKKVGLEIAEGLKHSSLQAVPLSIFFACVGIAIEMLVVTGLAQKFSYMMVSLAGGSFLLLLIMTALSAIIFGMGMPTPGAYILVALLGAPALVAGGSSLLAAHFFVLFYAVLSCIIPPVAIAPMVACGIAKTDFWDVALKALRLGLPAFILPFYFMYRPGILIVDSDLFHILYSSIAAFVALGCLSIVLEGYFIRDLKVLERIIIFAAALLIMDPGYLTTVIGIGTIFTMGLYVKFDAKRKLLDPSR